MPISGEPRAARLFRLAASGGEEVQGDGGGPGLVVGAEQLAGERLEVLPEPTDHDLFQGRPDYEELWAAGDCVAVTDVRTCEDEGFRQRVNRLA